MKMSRGLSRRAFLGGTVAAAAGTAGAFTFWLIDFPMGSSVHVSPGDAADVNARASFEFPPGRRAEAAHLLRRAGFGGSRAEMESLAGLSREEAVDRVMDFSVADHADSVLSELGVDPWNHPDQIGRWWALRMVYSSRPMLERFTLFWHDHFATSIQKVKDPWLMLGQNQLLRSHALGSFRDLVLATAKDPAMLIWLDNRLNVKGNPNENYARELMELHTIGIGNYTETDVKEAARAFTGWGLRRREQRTFRLRAQELREAAASPDLSASQRRDIRRELRMLERDYPLEFTFSPEHQDEGIKTFLGETGPWDGEDIIDLLVQSDACADFICHKLFAHLAYEEPSEATIDQLKATYFRSGYRLQPVVREILLSPEFYSDRAYRSRIKSPAQFVAGTVRALDGQTDGFGLDSAMASQGQHLFNPPNPAGWPGGPAWINGNTIIGRSNFAAEVAAARPSGENVSPEGRQRDRASHGWIDPASLLADATEAGQVAQTLVELLLDGNVTAGDLNILVEYLHTGPGGSYQEFSLTERSIDHKVRGLIHLILASPLYELS